jgi:ELWxxDGT repeat protein
MLKDIYPGFMWSDPDHLTVFDGKVYFWANDGVHGPELWRTDGTPSGTVLVRDVNPNNSSYYVGGAADNTTELCVAGGNLYFLADDGIHGWELWKTDGSYDGTTLVKDINPANTGRTIHSLMNVGGVLYFVADDGVHGMELWRSDGTEAGTRMVRDIAPGAANLFWTTNGKLDGETEFQVVNGILYFTATGSDLGYELWRTDGTESGTFLVADIFSGWRSSSPHNLTALSGILYFTADDGVNGRELWRSDGTLNGTFMIKDITYGPDSTYWRSELMEIDKVLYFVVNNGVQGTKLWRSDGTNDGTFMVGDLASQGNPFTTYGGGYGPFIELGGTIYFPYYEPLHGEELGLVNLP